MPQNSTTQESTHSATLKDLGADLIIRRATHNDAEALSRFQASQHLEPGEDFSKGVYIWMLDLMNGKHPTFRPSDFLVVEDTANGKIASSTCLISQTWRYGGVEIKVGQPELVATDPNYRRRGLIREQFEILHSWSAERGELVQAISGIPWYYRQFGYEMALPMGGGRSGYAPQVPRLPAEAEEPYKIRPAVEADLPFIHAMLDNAASRYEVTAVKSDEQLRYELSGQSEGSLVARELRIIETIGGEAAGLLTHLPYLWSTMLGVMFYELKAGVSWAAVTPSVVRYVETTGKEYAAKESKEWQGFTFYLGTEHPVYKVIEARLPRTNDLYAWYIRVPDLPAFLRQVAPVLEKRLAASLMPGHTGEVRLNFYRSGLRMVFEGGKLATIESWEPETGDSGDAAFPELTFLQLVFGYRTQPEIKHIFPDCWVRGDDMPVLLEAIFPKQPSSVWVND